MWPASLAQVTHLLVGTWVSPLSLWCSSLILCPRRVLSELDVVVSLLSRCPALGLANSPRRLLVRTLRVMFWFLVAPPGVIAMVLRQREPLV